MDDRTYINILSRAFLAREMSADETTRVLARLEVLGSREALVEEFIASQEAERQRRVPVFVPPGHFYSPIVDPATLAAGHFDAAPERIAGIGIGRENMVAMWKRLLPAISDHPFTNEKRPGWRYHFRNPAFQWADGLILHGMIRTFRPKRIIEVGSGWSSACMVDTVEHYLAGACDITMADPHPDLAQDLVGAYAGPHRFLRSRLQDLDRGQFEALEEDDILFVDSTHVLATGSDVHVMLFDVLPRLKPGVLVHFHDIFWPFDYPETWVRDENRSWNEAYALRAFLTDNPRWDVLWLADYFQRFEGERLQADLPDMRLVTGGSLWLRKLS